MTAYFSLPDVGQRFGVPVSRVKAWISSGLLAAVDVSGRCGSKRPRLRVSTEALALFEVARTVGVAPPAPKRRRPPATSYTKFYPET